ncbi:uncharacterized protein [Acropora muricata]|uniref:uncharacterized protein isoform X2 n=1 Tax=Acropora muricata TaxID=159855 RepID=UPI0034E4442E
MNLSNKCLVVSLAVHIVFLRHSLANDNSRSLLGTSVLGRSVSLSSHSGITGNLTYVTDGNISTCLTVQRKSGRSLWVRITLNMKSFVYKIWIVNNQGCCFAELPELQIVLRNSEQTREATCKVYDWKKQQRKLMICDPTIMATSLTIYAKGADNLTLCKVLVTSADDKLVARGVLQEVWHNIAPSHSCVLQYDTRFPDVPDEVTVGDLNDINDFDTNNYSCYGQRLTAYLSLPESGNHTFYVVWNISCNLKLRLEVDPNGNQIENDEKGLLLAELLIQHRYWYNRITKSKEIFLSKCRLYRVEVLMACRGKYHAASIGVKLPNGTYEEPIGKDRLFWVRPGKGSPKKILQSKNVESKHYHH